MIPPGHEVNMQDAQQSSSRSSAVMARDIQEPTRSERTHADNLASACAEHRRRAVASVAPGQLKYTGADEFFNVLKSRVEAYFQSTGRSKRDCPAMYLKTAILLAWFAASYVLLVFVAHSWWMVPPLAISMGLSVAAIGFNIAHDGGHHAYSNYRWINRLTALAMDLVGGSSYIWARKHNSIHHTYTNIEGHDDDINVGFLGRLAPEQTRHWFHRGQHWYLWVLYGFLSIKWQLFDDFHNVVTGRIGPHRFVRPRGWDLAILLGGKALFFSLAFVIPLMVHPVWLVLVVFGATSFVQGLVLSVVFQLAHCVECASFPMPQVETGRMETSWAVHQVATTVDFARKNRVLSWYVGGLNYQVEHHLFPQICHLHYEAIARVVEDVCREFRLHYMAHDTFLGAVASHFRWLRQMGRPVTAA
jgi:linoleoyl-CoA desaturase